ncbi:hypothetical protein ACFWTC_38580 [Streptomyces sp. NPDC058619]|uniref:hypothetical protein n=1 Tax=unclassified Streptomyces TaxID=2593676 RepID=UPI003664EB5D
MDTNEEFDRLMKSAARVRVMPLWEGPMPVAPGTWPRAAAVFAGFDRVRPGTDEAAVGHAVVGLELALASAGTGPVAGKYVRIETHKARGIAAIRGAGASPGKGIDTLETALHRAQSCGVNLHPYRQWGQINAITSALQRVHDVFRDQAGPDFPTLWADDHVAGWWRQTSLTACARIADLGLQRATPAAGYGGHPGVAALRDIGRAALVYTALADPAPDPAAPTTRPDLAIDLDELARAAAPGAPDLRAEAAARAQSAERAAVARGVSAAAARSRSTTTPTRRAPGQQAPTEAAVPARRQQAAPGKGAGRTR